MKNENRFNNKDNKKVKFTQNIELSNKISSNNQKKITKENILNKSVGEDEDVLRKYKESRKRRRNIVKNNPNREEAFSTVRTQLKEEFSLGKLGKIEWAKEHCSANRPMNKLKDFTKGTKFCNCCNLPCETPGIIERFSGFEDPENFSICGKAVPLYFYFIKYCVYCLIVVLFIMSIPMTIINSNNLSDLENYCNNLQENNIMLYYKDDEIDINSTRICEKYLETNTNIITSFIKWLWKASSDNIVDYNKFLYLLEENKVNITNITNKKNKPNKIYKTIKSNKTNIFINFSILGFFCSISLFVINIFFIILLKAKIKMEKIDNIRPSDYTILITDLQKMVKEFKDKNIEKENILNENIGQEDLTGGMSDYEYINMNFLKTQMGQFTQFLIDNLFYSQKSKQNLNIFNLNLCYKLNDFMVLKEKQEECKYKIFQIQNNPYQIEKNLENNYASKQRRYYTSFFNLIGLDCLLCSNQGESLEDLNKEKDIYEKNLNSLITKAKLNNFCGCIFATFNTVKDKEEFYNNFPHFFLEFSIYYIKQLKYYLCCCFIDKKKNKRLGREKIRVYLAPEPEDIIWENLEFTIMQRFSRILIIYTLSFLVIGIAFTIVYFLNVYQENIEKKNWSELSKYTASISITIIICILNAFLEYIMKIFTKMEKQKSMTKYYLSHSIKLTVFTFMTSAFVPYFTNYVKNNHNLEYHDNQILITNMFFLFLTNSLINPILWTINIPLLIKKVRIFCLERKKVPNAMHFKTQKELNDLYEYPDMDIASKYSFIYKTILMTMFYLPIFPLGVPISLLGLVLAYFLEKYNFTHSYKRPEMLNEKLGEFYLNFFIGILISYGYGDLFFTKGYFQKDSWPIVNIVVFTFLSIIPYTKPISYYFNSSKEFEVNSLPINDVYFSFCNDYQRQNPFTKKDGMYFYIHELKKRGYISKFIYDILIKNIEKINVMEIYYNTSKNPSLKEAQRTLTSMNKKKFSMEDLKKSITRIFREKIQKSNRKKLAEKLENEKKLNNNQNNGEKINKEGKSESESESESVNSKDSCSSSEFSQSRKESCSSNYSESSESSENSISRKESSSSGYLESIDDNININYEIKDNIKHRRNTEINKSRKLNSFTSDNDIGLSQAFTNVDNFLINQYNDPLLFSIGQGIKNIAFMNRHDLKKLKKNTNPNVISSESGEENNNKEKNNDEKDINIIINEKNKEDKKND